MQAVYGFAVFAFLAMVILQLLGPIIAFLFTVVFVVLLIWLACIAFGGVAAVICRETWLRTAASADALIALVDLEFAGSELRFSVSTSRLESHLAEHEQSTNLVAIVGVAGAILAFLLAPSAFQDAQWLPGSPISMGVSLTITALLAAFCVALTVPYLRGLGKLEQTMRRRVDEIAARRIKLPASWQALEAMMTDADRLSQRLELPFANDYTSALKQFVQSHKKAILSSEATLDAPVKDQMARLRKDMERLQRAVATSDSVMRRFDDARLAVNQTCSASMFALLDQLQQAQRFAKGYLAKGDWAGFERTMQALREHLDNLIIAAGKHRTEDAEPQHASGRSTQDPYAVLGVTPDMAPEQIDKVARSLLNIFHPDKALVKDDARFKEIMAAWEEIRRYHSH